MTEQFLGAAARSEDAAAMLADLTARGVEVVAVQAGDRLTIGASELEFLWPDRGYTPRIDNDASLIALLRIPTGAGERRILLTGDATETALGLLSQRGDTFDADIIEAPHHGSYNAAGAALVRVTSPVAVLQSTGARRGTDPRWLDAVGSSAWLSTAERGACAAWIERDGSVRWTTFR
ncbi:MAG: hypothetical protein H7Y88_08300 [Phycisphaerales bacterium]|nr:hypothetical protein [Phycisphaerales bacterium]